MENAEQQLYDIFKQELMIEILEGAGIKIDVPEAEKFLKQCNGNPVDAAVVYKIVQAASI